MKLSNLSSLAAIAGAVLALSLISPASAATSAAQSVTKACSAQYKAAKKAGTLPKDQKWPQFLSECSARMKGAAASAPAEKPASRETKKESKAEKTAKAGTPGHRTPKQLCNDEYKSAKTAGTLGGKKKKEFIAGCLASAPGGKEQARVPPEPKAGKALAPVKTVDKNGKPLTPAQVAFRKRIHECAADWQRDKAAGKTAGQKWPQYWSACNTRLKKAGD